MTMSPTTTRRFASPLRTQVARTSTFCAQHAHLGLVCGGGVERSEQHAQQPLAGLPAAEGVAVVREQEAQLLLVLALHLAPDRGLSKNV